MTYLREHVQSVQGQSVGRGKYQRSCLLCCHRWDSNTSDVHDCVHEVFPARESDLSSHVQVLCLFLASGVVDELVMQYVGGVPLNGALLCSSLS